MIFIGIDPGLTGAAAAIAPGGHVQIIDLPTKPMEYASVGARRIDIRALVVALRGLWHPSEPVHFVVEEVGIQGVGNAIQTVGSLCGTAMLILGAIDIVRADQVSTVKPATWKAKMGLKREKGEKDSDWKRRHRELALGLYHYAPITLAKHHNRAEALLIAHYGRQWLA